jgi:hypothetical protein
MGMVVHPSFAGYAVRDSSRGIFETPAVFSKQHKRLVEDEAINGPLNAVCAVVGVRPGLSV